MKNYSIFATVLLVAIAAAFFAGHSLKKERTIYVNVPLTITDTTFVVLPTVKIIHAPAKHDTVSYYVAVHDTIIQTDIAKLDTTLIHDGQIYGWLAVDYYPKPFDWFNVEFAPAPLPTITITKFIDQKRPWYSHPAFTASVGLVAGAAIINLTK